MNDNSEIHSPKVRHIIGDIPRKILVSGYIILVFVLFIILGCILFYWIYIDRQS